MAIYNLGSVADRVLGQIQGVPITISGLELYNIIDNQRLYVEERTGYSIGSVAIAEKFQPVLIALSSSAVVKRMMLEGADASNIRLGDFSISKGAGGNLESTSKILDEEATKMLQQLGVKIRYYKANG